MIYFSTINTDGIETATLTPRYPVSTLSVSIPQTRSVIDMCRGFALHTNAYLLMDDMSKWVNVYYNNPIKHPMVWDASYNSKGSIANVYVSSPVIGTYRLYLYNGLTSSYTLEISNDINISSTDIVDIRSAFLSSQTIVSLYSVSVYNSGYIFTFILPESLGDTYNRYYIVLSDSTIYNTVPWFSSSDSLYIDKMFRSGMYHTVSDAISIPSLADLSIRGVSLPTNRVFLPNGS